MDAAEKGRCGPFIDLHDFIVDNDLLFRSIGSAMRALGAGRATLVSRDYVWNAKKTEL